MPALAEPDDWHAVLWAIGGHHPAFDRESPPRQAKQGCGAEMVLLLDHVDFRTSASWLQTTFRLGACPVEAARTVRLESSSPDSVFTRLRAISREARDYWERIRKNNAEKRLIAAVKVCLVAVDVAGSALPKVTSNQTTRMNWIRKALERVPTPDDLRGIVRDRLGAAKLRGDAEPRHYGSSRLRVGQNACSVPMGCRALRWKAALCLLSHDRHSH
jgi:hypothetical protein